MLADIKRPHLDFLGGATALVGAMVIWERYYS